MSRTTNLTEIKAEREKLRKSKKLSVKRALGRKIKK